MTLRYSQKFPYLFLIYFNIMYIPMSSASRQQIQPGTSSSHYVLTRTTSVTFATRGRHSSLQYQGTHQLFGMFWFVSSYLSQAHFSMPKNDHSTKTISHKHKSGVMNPNLISKIPLGLAAHVLTFQGFLSIGSLEIVKTTLKHPHQAGKIPDDLRDALT